MLKNVLNKFRWEKNPHIFLRYAYLYAYESFGGIVVFTNRENVIRNKKKNYIFVQLITSMLLSGHKKKKKKKRRCLQKKKTKRKTNFKKINIK